MHHDVLPARPVALLRGADLPAHRARPPSPRPDLAHVLCLLHHRPQLGALRPHLPRLQLRQQLQLLYELQVQALRRHHHPLSRPLLPAQIL